MSRPNLEKRRAEQSEREFRPEALCAAIKTGNYGLAKQFIDAGWDVNRCTLAGSPPLFLALLKELPVFHKKVNASHAKQLDAVETGSESLFDLIVNHPNCDLNEVDPITKQTALHFSVSEQLESLVVMLMKSKSSTPCDVGIKNRQGQTALHLAVSKANTSIVEVLLQNDSCLSDVFTGLQTCRGYPYNTDGWTALHLACKRGNLAILRLLVERLRNLPTQKNSSDENSNRENNVFTHNLNALTRYTHETCLHLAAIEGHIQIMNYLVECQADVDVKDASGNTPLILFLVSDYQWDRADNSVPSMLLRHGANPNTTTSFMVHRDDICRSSKVTPLMLAAMHEQDNIELARVLIQHGADVNMTDSNGNTAVYYALCQKSAKVASYLLRDCSHTDFNIENIGRDSCVFYIANNYHDDADLMQQYVGAIFDRCGELAVSRFVGTALEKAFYLENHLLMDAVLERIGIYDANSIRTYWDDWDVEDLLVRAADSGFLPMVRILLSHGVDIDTRVSVFVNYELSSCLEVSLSAHKNLVAKYLIDNGCSLELDSVTIAIDDSDNSDAISKEVCALLKEASQTPRSLELMCLCCLRKRLIANKVPFSKVHLLPLPPQLQNSIRYR
ncbi:hypothetical protein DPMN_173165 [Dreissena polymorpha]|nr:hypothetical protein DPMN_173165 [Dreissena polymorpha]